jgi:hypothetical protein
MKSLSLVVLVAALAGCSVNSSTPVTAWGKKDVSLLEYRTDAGQCAVLAATHQSGGNGANTAGGINGQNSSAPDAPPASGSSTAASGGQTSTSSATPSITGGTYRDSASADFVNRAAMQQRSQEMAEQRARSESLKSCLTNRGYTEFELTGAQRAELAKLPQGSDERRDFLYKLGTNPDVLSNQATKK